MKYKEHYKITKNQEPQFDAEGLIQWKNTQVCIDLHCTCGYHGHCDEEFFYYYECPSCHKKYAVGATVKLIEMTKEQIDFIESELHDFVTCELDDGVIRGHL